MGNSNTEWAEYANDPEASRRWDEYMALPELPTDDDYLNTLLTERGLFKEDLERVGARWGSYMGKPALVYMMRSWRKYRTVGPGKTNRAADAGSEFKHLHIVRAATLTPSDKVIIAEGETDAALLSRLCPDYDIAVLPLGAKTFTEEMAQQAGSYVEVLVATDNDEAGDAGAEGILAMVPSALRLRPPADAKDWCEAYVKGLIDEPFNPVGTAVRPSVPVFTIKELMDAPLGSDADNNWFESAIAPRGGEIVIHGPMKSLKSVLLMEMLRAMTTGTHFADYIPFMQSSGPGRALLVQFEVPPQQFQQRMVGMAAGMSPEEVELFSQNCYVYEIASGTRPRLKLDKPEDVAKLMRAIEACDPDIVAFDPVQRMTGKADINNAAEADAVLDLFAELMNAGKTVIYTHHNNKANHNSKNPYSMAGTQRFGADADSICSVYHDKTMLSDDNELRMKQRGFAWHLRNSASPPSRTMKATPSALDDNFMVVTYDVLPKIAPPVDEESSTVKPTFK